MEVDGARIIWFRVSALQIDLIRAAANVKFTWDTNFIYEPPKECSFKQKINFIKIMTHTKSDQLYKTHIRQNVINVHK